MSDGGNEVYVAVGGVVSTIIAGIVSYFGGRGNAQAQLQAALNETMKDVLRTIKDEREECHKELAEVKAEIMRLRGELNNTRQFAFSLMNIMERNGIDIPTRKGKYRDMLQAVTADAYVFEVEVEKKDENGG